MAGVNDTLATIAAAGTINDKLIAYFSGNGTSIPMIKPETFGAVGDGVTDDSVAIQAAFNAAGLSVPGSVVSLTRSYRITRNLYIFGVTDVVGTPSPAGATANLILDADLTLSDGSEYWINFGIESKGGVKKTWNGVFSRVSIYLTANAVVQRMLNIHVGRDCWITRNFIDAQAATSAPSAGFVGCYNNSAWCNGSIRDRIRVTENVGLAAQAAASGSEFIGIGNATRVWVKDNYGSGWGDDAVGLHHVDYFEVSGNKLYTPDGRIYLGGCRYGDVHNNRIERIVDSLSAWTSGGALIMAETTTTADPATTEVNIHDNICVHGSGITSATYGIRVRGPRRCRVHDNIIHDTSGYGYGVWWENIALANWVDGEGLDATGQIRIHELDIVNNRGTGTPGALFLSEANAAITTAPGPIVVRGNVIPTGCTITVSTYAAYRFCQMSDGSDLIETTFSYTGSAQSWTVPFTGVYEVEAIGGGGGGGGGGSATTSGGITNQVGGGGGAAGVPAKRIASLTAGTVVTVTPGAGGTSGAGGAANNHTGVNGGVGGDTTVVGTGISLTAKGGFFGRLGAANSATTAAGGLFGAATSTSTTGLGNGGASSSVGGNAGGNMFGLGSGAGGSGQPAGATLGGLGGAGGTPGVGGAGTTGNGGAGTADGANGTDATGIGGGGGGGGGGAPGGAGGNGGLGTAGSVTVRLIKIG